MFVNSPVGLEINGSLWTLRLEFLMYLMVLVLGVVRLLTVRVALLLVAFGMACLHFNMLDELEKWGWFFQLLSGWGWLVAFFAAGMVLYKLRHTRIFDGRIALLALAGLVLSVPLHQFILLFPLFGCYLALWLALTPRLPVFPAARFGDLSYGIYIYGWPTEQGAIWLLGGHAAWWQVFLIALPAAAGIIFREVPPTYDLDWHPAPRRQYIINLDAGVEITASDGEVRKIGAGEVFLVEDTTGKGHLSKAIDNKIRNCIFVPIE